MAIFFKIARLNTPFWWVRYGANGDFFQNYHQLKRRA
jgi:hypothetical protein